MENPWKRFGTKPPFVIPEDEAAICAFNARSRPASTLHLEILPEPFLGRPDANIILLNLNPGFSHEEIRYHHLDSYFASVARKNLLHEEQDFPFYFLDPGYHSPGHVWWQKRLGALLELYGPRRIANEVLCVEFFPYHSEHFGYDGPRLHSQDYSFYLVRRAIQRNSAIIIMRSKWFWLAAVPELASSNYFELNSPQAVYVSQGNAGAGFAAIRERLERRQN